MSEPNGVLERAPGLASEAAVNAQTAANIARVNSPAYRAMAGVWRVWNFPTQILGKPLFDVGIFRADNYYAPIIINAAAWLAIGFAAWHFMRKRR